MSFIRPEAQAALTRYREALIGLGIMVLGLYWALGPGGLLGWVGWALMPFGGALIVVGLRRARFRQDGEGPGIVRVDEGKISYFGPLSGGAVAASELTRLSLDPTGDPMTWVLDMPERPPLHIPVNAVGSEALFDAFVALPGLDMRRLLQSLEHPGVRIIVLWEHRAALPSDRRLH
ncbi:MAG: hypothetical protein ACWA5A_18335 [Marinibacterium sp.]